MDFARFKKMVEKFFSVWGFICATYEIEEIAFATTILRNLLNNMDVYAARVEELLEMIEEKLKEIPYINKLMAIKGVGLLTVSGFIAEAGDIKRFDNPKQLQKLAGYAIVANESGKHKGESRISYRGRKRLRYVLYEAALLGLEETRNSGGSTSITKPVRIIH